MLKTFRIGGIHPPENKLSAGKEIETFPIPEQVAISLSQHIGAPAQPVVKKGDTVKVGTLIGKANGYISANIHASVSGTVAKIEEIYDSSGYKRPAVIIDVSGDEWEPSINRDESLQKTCDLSPEEIRKRIFDAGIVGLGGATFPTSVKLTVPKDARAEILIVNAVECEPYLTADHALMLERSEAILIGITIAMKAIGVTRSVIGIENNKKDAIDRMLRLSTGYPGIDICPLQVKYPQGGEKQLIDAVLRKQVESGSLPITTGAVVMNVGSVFAVYEAVQKNKPLIERVVTVTGKSVRRPSNFRTRIGTPIRQLIEAAGGCPANTGKIVSGGPLMGKSLVSLDIPVSKGCSGILMLSEEETRRKPAGNCIRCAKCVFACPMGLTPNLLMSLTEFQEWDRAEQEHITDCMECGCCSYTCPANRPILDYVRTGKNRVNSRIQERNRQK